MIEQQRFKSLGEEAGYRMCIDELVEPLRKENSELKENVERLEKEIEDLQRKNNALKAEKGESPWE